MTAEENAQALLGAVDAALQRLGEAPLANHPQFRRVDVPGRFATYVLEKPGAASLRFEFGYELEIGVDGVPEVYVGSADDLDRVGADVVRMLTSAITVRSGARDAEVVVWARPGDAWFTSKRRALGSYRRDGPPDVTYEAAFG